MNAKFALFIDVPIGRRQNRTTKGVSKKAAAGAGVHQAGSIDRIGAAAVSVGFTQGRRLVESEEATY